MVLVIRSGAPKDGCELAYRLALKHRAGWMRLLLQTPWWQWSAQRRRWHGWQRAMDRFHRSGRDVSVTVEIGAAA